MLGQLHADLVRAAGLQPDAWTSDVSSCGASTAPHPCRRGALPSRLQRRARRGRTLTSLAASSLREPVVQGPTAIGVRRPRPTAQHTRAPWLVRAHLLGSGARPPCSCAQTPAGRQRAGPCRCTRPQVHASPGLLIAFLDVQLQPARAGSRDRPWLSPCASRLARLDQHHDQVIVLVEDYGILDDLTHAYFLSREHVPSVLLPASAGTAGQHAARASPVRHHFLRVHLARRSGITNRAADDVLQHSRLKSLWCSC